MFIDKQGGGHFLAFCRLTFCRSLFSSSQPAAITCYIHTYTPPIHSIQITELEL